MRALPGPWRRRAWLTAFFDIDPAVTLLGAAGIVAACTFIYELLLSTQAAYLLGNSVYHYSVTIGAFMAALGGGAFLSRFIREHVLTWFLVVEIGVALAGGFAALILYAVFAFDGRLYSWALFSAVAVVGGLCGLELPLLTRLIRERSTLREAIAGALSLDYLGALAAAIAFPLALLPLLGLVRTGLVAGLINLAVALTCLAVFRHAVDLRLFGPLGLASSCALAGGFLLATHATSLLEQRLFRDEIIYAAHSPYQRIVLTKWKDDLRLYLDGNLQFSSLDEYRYHEALVQPALSLAPWRSDVLILGGGDGLALREVLRDPDVERVTLVDLDPAVTHLARTFGPLVALNQGALADPRVEVVHEDAFSWLERTTRLFPIIVIDLPDPRTPDLGKLYSVEFYRLAARHLARGGMLAVQATSPYHAREAYWSIGASLEAAGLQVLPYHVLVPTFGEWGFYLASDLAIPHHSYRPRTAVRFLTAEAMARAVVFEPDIAPLPVAASTLDRQEILDYYARAWREWRGR
ncbi:MAG: polyamine aminopropyltransferase [Chloroflexota bacterium]|nr:polyamine aminopropyltransferase [Dehalococcoidia bacterium]MDW8254058.1 polyamine aminopropyltransferase [Chloroflexota bacterium]